MIEITNDLFGIAERLKAVDDEYRLFYNTARSRYEVFKRGSRAFIVPFSELDARTLDYAWRTRNDINGVVAEIEQHNNRLDEQAAQAATNKLLEVL